MESQGIFCAKCGITMRRFMKVCPRCGADRVDADQASLDPATVMATAAGLAAEAASKSDANADDQPDGKTSVIPLGAIRQGASYYDEEEFAPPQNFVLLSPSEEKRRFPLFTRAQLSLMAVGIGLVLLALIVVGLLWRQQRRDVMQASNALAAQAQPTPALVPTPDPNASPTPSLTDDQAIGESVKNALMAYNPLGFQRYNFEVKDGVVTINGSAEHQPEKDGAENVLRLLAGVKSVVNNLQIKPGLITEPVRLNLAEAKLLDEAMNRQLQENQPNVEPRPAPTPDPQREAERLRREQLAAKQREEEASLRRAAEEKLRRETEEYEKRLEELRRAEAERRARAEQARTGAATLRYGTVAWSGIVDGVDEIVISGSSASVRHLSGNVPREVRASFSTPIPRSPVEVKLIWVSGRGAVDIIQQPSAANGYTTIVRVDDSQKGGDKQYEFTLRWGIL